MPQAGKYVALSTYPCHTTPLLCVLQHLLPGDAQLITNYRALGAPLALEVREDCIIPWRVGLDAQTTNQFAGRIPLNAIEATFKQREPEWNPETILRRRTLVYRLARSGFH